MTIALADNGAEDIGGQDSRHGPRGAGLLVRLRCAAMDASRDDARSDLLLSAAAYLFGPLFVGLLLSVVPIHRVPGLPQALAVVLPLVFTVLVPALLMRYRNESLRDYGFGDGPDSSAVVGLIVALPIVGAGLVVALLVRGDPTAALPMFPSGASPFVLASASPVLVTAERLAQWVGLAFLALYVSVKARDAFGTAPVETGEAVRKIGMVVGIGAAATTALLVVASLAQFDLGRIVATMLAPLAVAAAVVIAVQRLGLSGSTVFPALVVPVVIMAIGPFRFTFEATRFLSGLYGAALYAGLGLIIGLLVERTRRGLGVVMLGIVIATLSVFGPFGFPA